MKKIISLLLPLAILFSGCSQEELQNSRPTQQDGKIFTASFEQSETRTYVEEGNLLRWNAGDQISLFDGNTLNRQYRFDGETGDDSGTFSIVSCPDGTGNGLNANYAVYPYASDMEIDEDGLLSVILPSDQSYAVNSFGLGANTMVAITEDTEDVFLKFKNVCGYLKLQLYGDDITIRSITLTGNNNEKIAGRAAVTPIYECEPAVSMADDANASITLDCGENGVEIGPDVENATAFWIVVPPVTFECGFEITITDIDGEVITKSTYNEITVGRNVVKPMAAIEIAPENDVQKPADNEIWYTNGSTTEPTAPYATNVFGANIVSNTYDAKKECWVIKFDGEITSIGADAFYFCDLVTIIIPDSVIEIGERAFRGCQRLTDVKLPENITKITFDAFNLCLSLESIEIPESVVVIENRAFESCSKLSSVVIPDRVTAIYDDAFSFCGNLESLTIGRNVATIGNNAFYYCKSLTDLTIPDSVTAIGDYAFYQCYKISDLTLSNSLTRIGAHAFQFCESLTEVTIPDSVTIIEVYGFEGCENLSSVTLGCGLKTIESYAFYNCDKLSSIYSKAITPPSFDYHSIFSTEVSGRKIYVPMESVTTYKSRYGWRDYADEIVGYNF